MEKLPMCRVCLAENVRMYIVVNRNLHKLYEKLTDIPFVTEDSRPILACFLCCAKLKQCYRLLRQCLEAEEQFAQKMNEDYEPNSLINQYRLELFGGLIKSPIVHISINDECEPGSTAIKQELPAVCEGVDGVIEPKDENQSDELELENFDNSCLDVADIQPHHSESDLEDDEPLMEFKTEEEEEVSKKKRRVRDKKKPELENLDNSCLDEADIPPHHSESDLEDDEPLMEIKTDEEGEEVSKKKRRVRDTKSATVAKKVKLDTERTKLEDEITAEPTKKENSESKVLRTTQKRTSKPGTYFKESYKCDVCHRSFSQKSNLKTHTRIHTGEKPYKCDVCQRSFSQMGYLSKHTRIHTAEKPYKCDVCHCSFSQKSHLTDHIRIHTGVKPFKCNVCQRSFSKNSNLRIHTRIHTGEKPYKCDVCQRSFSQMGYLSKHTRIHTGEKPYKCDVCHCSFSQKSHLTDHIRIHTGVKPFKCNVCQRSFSRNSNLSMHTRIHTGEKPYKCDICQRSFITKCNSLNHIRRHTGEKPYKCDVCQRSFSRKGDLSIHTRIHTGVKPYECDVCHCSFSKKIHLTDHIGIHTFVKRFKCNVCQLSFSQKSSLRRHIRIHTEDTP